MPYSTIKTIIIFCLMLATSAATYAKDKPMNPFNEIGLFQQAIQMGQDGKWSNAEKIFRGIAERNPSWPEPKNNLAVALYQTGKLEQSHLAFEDAVTSLPSFKVAQINRQKLYDYSASVAYNKAVGISKKPGLPKLEMLNNLEDMSLSQSLNDAKNTAARDNEIYAQVRDRLLQWSQSWSDSNIDDYLAAYSNKFIPSGEIQNHAIWSSQRRKKLSRHNINQISLDNIQVYLDNSKHQALAEFVQNYKSDTYQDKVLKLIRLSYINNRWLIVSEEVLQELN